LPSPRPCIDRSARTALTLLALELLAGSAAAAPPYAFARTDDVVYCVGAVDSGLSTADLLLDLYEPAGTVDKMPGLVLVHGGGFLTGSKSQAEMEEIAEAFAAAGWVVGSIDYRLLGDGPVAPPTYMPFGDGRDKARHAAVVDTKCAIRWMRSRPELRVVPDQVFALGASSGGFAVVAAATSTGFVSDLPGQPLLPAQHPGPSDALAGIVDLWGAALADDLDAGDPPMAIVHGTADATIPFSFSQDLADAADAAGTPHELVPLVGEDHAAFSATIDGDSLAEYSIGFLEDAIPVPEPGRAPCLVVGAVLLAIGRRRRGRPLSDPARAA